MTEAFVSYPEEHLAERLLRALEAGDPAGGEFRQNKSEALLLVREEGAGILNFALQGLAELRSCLDSDGRFPRSDRQTERIDKLLDESDSVRAYVREGLLKKAGCTISVDDVVNEYLKFCEKKGWDGVTEKQVKDQLKDLIFEFHSEVQQRSPSPRHWKNLAVAP